MSSSVWETWKKQDGKASFNLLRLPFVELRNAYPTRRLRGAEVGVFRGVNAERILREMAIEHLWLVDCWGHFNNEPQTQQRQGVAEDPGFWDKVFAEVNDKFSQRSDTTIVKAWSEEAVNLVPNELDFIYLDADHSYEAALKDLNLWLPKLRLGGWLMGDDFMWEGTHQAVNEFVAEHNYILHSGSKNTQWWLIKDHDLGWEVVR